MNYVDKLIITLSTCYMHPEIGEAHVLLMQKRTTLSLSLSLSRFHVHLIITTNTRNVC